MYLINKMNFKSGYIAQLAILIVTITIIFCLSYHLTTLHAWKVPLGYGGDLWFALAIIKSYMIGDFPLIGFKFVSLLNAPAVANWNDYPITEDIIFYSTGQLAKVIGLYAATNFLLLMSHMLAGISFWVVCKYYKVSAYLALSGALAFAFSHFIFIRGLGHIVVGFCWHIPLLLMLLEWVYNKKPVKLYSSTFYVACIISFIAGILNPYYSIMYCQLLLFAIIYFCCNKKFINIRFPLTLMGVTVLGFILVNSDSILYGLINGSNSAFSGRNLASLELYALKIPDMFFSPMGGGSWFANFSKWVYYDRAYVKGELWSPYLGFFGILSLIIFVLSNSFQVLKGKFINVSVHYWHAIWIVLFSIVGGINLLFGTVGFTYLRATNRLSIFILAIVTIYALRYLTKHLPHRMTIVAAVIIISLVWYEQLAPRIKGNPPVPNAIEMTISSDKIFVDRIESLNPNGKIFMLPVMKFPEVGPINKMGDYEPFRLFLNSNTLHYSYGANKGRGDSEWQRIVENSSPEEMVEKLQKFGFDVIVINRKGYDDNAEWLIAKLRNYLNAISESDDYIAFQLNPSYEESTPIVSFPDTNTNPAWSTDEKTHRWARKSTAEIAITNFNTKSTHMVLSFEIFSLVKSDVKIYLNDQLLKEIEIPTAERKSLGPINIEVLPGKNYIRIKSNKWPKKAGNGDKRRLTFAISKFKLVAHE